MKNLDFKIIFKRISAYMIDIIITVILSSVIMNIPYFNNKYNEYEKKYNEYQIIYKDYETINQEFINSYKDKEIDIEEYNELSKNKTYFSIIEKAYEDQTISQEEYDETIKEIKKQYNEDATEYNYKLQKLGIFNSILTLTITLLYFGVLQYFLKGQTIGKKIMNLKIVSANEKPINVLHYILRSLIINNVFLNGVNLLILAFASKNTFIQSSNIISLMISIVEAVTIYLVVSREDHRGIHDLICNTKVISVQKEKVIIETKETPKKVKRKDS